MALMFQRLARNFIKNGYYPTDADTMTRVLSALVAPKTGQLRIIDPCAGEGSALAECKHHLGAERVEAFGVEYDNERAWHAKQILDRCIHGDIQDCVLGQRQYGLLWLNPPYGDLVSDKGSTGDQCGGKGRKRLEKLFYNLTISALQFEGVMVLIIPQYTLDKELVSWITTHFHRIEVFKAPEQQFKQIVLFGVHRRTKDARRRLCRYFAKNYLASMPKIHSLTRQLIPFAPTVLRPSRLRTTSFLVALRHDYLK